MAKSYKLKMSLFESEHMPDPYMDGKSFPNVRQGYDDNGDYESSLSLTFNQYKQDQVLQMNTYEKNGLRNYGFSIYDRPNIPLSETIEKYQELQKQVDSEEKQKAISEIFEGHNQRAFLGKSQNGEVSVRLMDSKGKDRIRMVIDANDVPRMEFLNEKGEVVYKLPPE